MGWAGPANWARLSHRKGWADFGPKWLGRSRPEMVGLNSAQHFLFISLGPGRTQPRNLGWARYGLAQRPLHEQWA